MADEIRVDYTQLQQAAAQFARQATAINQTQQQVRRSMGQLQSAWVGQGSGAFFTEMSDKVLSATNRLYRALQDASKTTRQIAQLMEQAENDAAAPFKTGAEGAGAGESSGQSTGGVTASGPFHLGPPQRPSIRHDNGFLDQFPMREPTLQDQLDLVKWRAVLEGSEALRPDLADANAAYRHFLEGGGSDRTFSYERYAESDPSGQKTVDNLIVDAQHNAEVIGRDRAQFSMTSDAYSTGGSDPRFPYPATENWQKAIGGHPVWTSADVQVAGTLPDRTYTMTITIHAEDRYNFIPGAADIATGIPDDDNGVFEVTGLAHQYTNYGEMTRTVTWQEGDMHNAEINDTDADRNRRPADNRRIRNQI